eukprot:46459-Eustigmatos_ZCMA.PRE.1
MSNDGKSSACHDRVSLGGEKPTQPRLYELDRIISSFVSYSPLTASKGHVTSLALSEKGYGWIVSQEACRHCV